MRPPDVGVSVISPRPGSGKPGSAGPAGALFVLHGLTSTLAWKINYFNYKNGVKSPTHSPKKYINISGKNTDPVHG